MMFGYELVVIFVMLVLNGIFAAYEMALASVSRARLDVLAHQKKKGAQDAVFMKDRLEASLAVVQVGITLVGAFAAATGGVGVHELLGPKLIQWGFSETWAEVVSVVCLIIPYGFLSIVFSELIPKMLALNNKEWVCLGLSPAMRWLSRVAYPVVAVFEWVVKKSMGAWARWGHTGGGLREQQSLSELKAAAALARTARLMGAREEKIVVAAASLSIRPLKDIIIPAAEISMIPVGSNLTDAFVAAHMDMHTRFPVCTAAGDPQTIQGYVNFKDIPVALKINPSSPTIQGITRPITSFAEDLPISQTLERMIQEKAHIAIVRNAEGQVSGLVTLEDIIEELVGEIEDEFDRLPAHIYHYGNSWIVGGGVRMETLAATLGIGLPAEEKALPVTEWFSRRLGRALNGGEMVPWEDYTVMVRKLRRKKLAEAMVYRQGEAQPTGF